MSEDLICHRCGRLCRPGKDNFYVVRIEAVADPTPPHIDTRELEEIDFDAEIQRAIDQTQQMSERELSEQIYARRTIHLCGSCYRGWIENPAGG